MGRKILNGPRRADHTAHLRAHSIRGLRSPLHPPALQAPWNSQGHACNFLQVQTAMRRRCQRRGGL